MENQCLLRIRSLYSSFTKKEKKVADYVMDNSTKVIYMSITELSDVCGVGETTIIRFCRKLDVKGYQEFKLLLAREMIDPEENLHENISHSDNLLDIIKKITQSNIQAIQDTASVVSSDKLYAAVNAILNADKVDLYGVGASAFTAGDAKYKLLRIGINAEAVGDPHMQCMSAVNLTSKSVAIGISFSGSTKDTVDSLTLAHKSGAFTIAITNYEKSPITKAADVVLLTSARETPLRSGALTSKIAQLHLLDILYTALAIRKEEKAYEFLNKTAEAVLSKLY